MNTKTSSEENFEFTDPRDNKTYKVVKIGNQTWMAENLNYEVKDQSWCYSDKPENGEQYGRLYTWAAARNACPEGWHLPTDKEWQTLYDFVKVEQKLTGEPRENRNKVGTHLKSSSDWVMGNGIPLGIDTYGFSALPVGNRNKDDRFRNVKHYTRFWSSTEIDSDNAQRWCLDYDNESFFCGKSDKKHGFSVRCIMNEEQNFLLQTKECKMNYKIKAVVTKVETGKIQIKGVAPYRFEEKKDGKDVIWNILKAATPKDSEFEEWPLKISYKSTNVVDATLLATAMLNGTALKFEIEANDKSATAKYSLKSISTVD